MKYPYQCRPNDVLPDNTPVHVDGRGRGLVHKSEITTDQHGSPITLHHIKFPNGEVLGINYSFIWY